MRISGLCYALPHKVIEQLWDIYTLHYHVQELDNEEVRLEDFLHIESPKSKTLLVKSGNVLMELLCESSIVPVSLLCQAVHWCLVFDSPNSLSRMGIPILDAERHPDTEFWEWKSAPQQRLQMYAENSISASDIQKDPLRGREILRPSWVPGAELGLELQGQLRVILSELQGKGISEVDIAGLFSLLLHRVPRTGGIMSVRKWEDKIPKSSLSQFAAFRISPQGKALTNSFLEFAQGTKFEKLTSSNTYLEIADWVTLAEVLPLVDLASQIQEKQTG